MEDLSAIKAFLAREGYAVIRKVVPRDVCLAATAAFEQEVKPSRDYFKRHEWGRFERHVFTEQGAMKFPIMNIQDLSRKFSAFRTRSLELLTHAHIQSLMQAIFGEPGRVIHTMFFDGNQRTPAHRDSHYIDSERIGEMVGVWVAAEDIHPEAGRFYVCPRSHRIGTPADLRLDQLDPNDLEYKMGMGQFVRGTGLPLVAPALEQGDVLLWSSLVIHGSLETMDPGRTRRSFTAHYIPGSSRFLGKRRQPGCEQHILVNGVKVTVREDQGRWANQARAALLASLRPYPGLLDLLRKAWRRLGGTAAQA
jgi:phytanoyl-CoA hydroxylase